MRRAHGASRAGALLTVLACLILVAAAPAPAAPAPARPAPPTAPERATALAPTGSLTEVARFGANPSKLKMFVYVPARPAPRPALLVAVHYCTGTAKAFFNGGARDFVTAADQYGFLIVFPEATRSGGCFDVWSQQALTRGGGSDPVGIMSMVSYARRAYHADRDQIFVTGASSGAMMTNVLAAQYPDVFAAGSAFSGVPAGCFATTGDSTWNSQCSSGQITHTGQQWGDLARAMNPRYRGRYPRMQLWHGAADTTLAYANLGEEVKQWTNLDGVAESPVVTDNPEPYWTRTRYGTGANRAPVESISVAGAGHTLPQHLMVSYAIGFLGLNRAAHGRPLPSQVQWHSTGALMAPKSDATHAIISVKDPSVVRHKGRWLVYFTTVDSAGKYNMAYTSFRDWADAPSAPYYYLDRSAIGPGYRAAPQLFYFAPRKLWYLVYQSDQGASYSTTTDPTKPETWSAAQPFFSSMPEIIEQNIGTGHWVDMWVICDKANCHLFSSDDNGHLYRSQTRLKDFPRGFDTTVIALDSPNSKFRLFEASNVYRVKGTGSYVLMVEASASARYFRAWTSNRLNGTWTPLATSQAHPFAGATNVTFDGTPWTTSISHGEMVRAGYDQTMTINPRRLQYLYQGVDPTATASYTFLPWHLGLLTQAPAAGLSPTATPSLTD
jgi:poly(hydroxyalkanoate) depolymerase family esterase